jgi:hypothetical protein
VTSDELHFDNYKKFIDDFFLKAKKEWLFSFAIQPNYL